MSYVTVAELRDALGIGALYDDDTVQSCIDAAEGIILPMLSQQRATIILAKPLQKLYPKHTQRDSFTL